MMSHIRVPRVVIIALSALVVLVLPQSSSGYINGDYLPEYTASCVGAKLVRAGELDFCSMVNWRTANLYNSSTYSSYNPTNGLSARDQEEVAKDVVTSILSRSGTGGYHSPCRAAVRRFACVSTFPYCPSVGSSTDSTSYLPACNRQCMQVHDICKDNYFSTTSLITLDCSSYPVDRNCVLNVPTDRFLLLPDQGPYDSIAGFYMIMLTLWVVLSALWLYWVFMVFPDDVLPVSKGLLSLLPLVRVCVAVMSLVFWLDCALTADMCEVQRASVLYVLFPILEAVQLYVFLAVAKGWSVTRAYLPPFTWRFHLALCFGFYITLTIFFGTLDASSPSWVIYSVVMYGTMYAVLLTSARREMAVLASQVKALSPTMAPLAAKPLREKCHLFRYFLGLAFCSLLLEVVCRYLFAARVGPFYVLVMVYELGSTVLVVLLGWLYRPRQYSPFFFMMPTSLEYGALLSQEAAEDMEDATGGRGRNDSTWWQERRARMRLLDQRVHSREREDDVADLARMRFARVHRPSPMVEVSLFGDHRFAAPVADTITTGPVSASLSGSLSGSPRRMSRTKDTAGRDRHQIPPPSLGGGAGPAEAEFELSASPQQQLQQHQVQPRHGENENESLDLTRLVSHLLLPSSLPRGRYQSREEQLTVEMELLGLSQTAAVNGGDNSNNHITNDNILGSAGDNCTSTDVAEREMSIATAGAAMRDSAERSADVDAGLHTTASAAAAPTVPAAPVPLVPLVPFWRQNSRAPPSTTRVIALTSPDQQEIMLAVHRSIPPTPSFR